MADHKMKEKTNQNMMKLENERNWFRTEALRLHKENKRLQDVIFRKNEKIVETKSELQYYKNSLIDMKLDQEQET